MSLRHEIAKAQQESARLAKVRKIVEAASNKSWLAKLISRLAC